MTEGTRAFERADDFHRPHVQSAFTLSVQSVVWTVISSSLAITLGIRSNTAVLVAFGAIGIVDAIGSIALVYHFHQGLRHDELSERLETISHRIVLIGLLVVGCSAVVGGVLRMRFPQKSETSRSKWLSPRLCSLRWSGYRRGSNEWRVASTAPH